jgi:hypothetical protein
VAARRARPPVHEQVLAGLKQCREDGLDFEASWLRTVGREGSQRGTVIFPHQTKQRRAWREALAATREEWRAAFDGVQTPLSAALRALAATDDESTFATHASGRTLRSVHLPPVSGFSSRATGRPDLDLDSRDVLSRIFASNHTRRELAA